MYYITNERPVFVSLYRVYSVSIDFYVNMSNLVYNIKRRFTIEYLCVSFMGDCSKHRPQHIQ
jgi:hypothetical protein